MFTYTTTLKKITSSLLALAMVLSFVQPFTAFAQEEIAQEEVAQEEVIEQVAEQEFVEQQEEIVVEGEAQPLAESVSVSPSVSLSVNGSSNPSPVDFDSTNTLSWTSSNATICRASGSGAILTTGGAWADTDNSAFGTSGSVDFRAAVSAGYESTLTFNIECESEGDETTSASVSVSVNQPIVNEEGELSLELLVNNSTSPASVMEGNQGTLSWTSSNATICRASGDAALLVAGGAWADTDHSALGTSGSVDFRAITAAGYDSNLTFTVVCEDDQDAVITKTVSIPVQQESNGGNPGSVTVSLLVNGSVSPEPVAVNSTNTLSWTSSNATICRASGDAALLVAGGAWADTDHSALGTSGSFSFTASTTAGYDSNLIFNIECQSGAEESSTASVTLAVIDPSLPQAPSVTLLINDTQNPASVVKGSVNTVSWNAANASSCRASGSSVLLVAGGAWADTDHSALGTSGSFSFNALTAAGYVTPLVMTITCENNENQESSKTIELIVTEGDNGGNGGNGENNPTATIRINGSESNVTLLENATGTVSWVSTNASSCRASGDVALLVAGGAWADTDHSALPTSGSFEFRAITEAGYKTPLTFSITCENTSDVSATDVIVVTVTKNTTPTDPTEPTNPTNPGTTTPTRSSGGGRSGGPCIGYGCPTAIPVDTTVPADIWILLDNVAATGNPAPAPAKVCRYDDLITRFMKKGITNDPTEVQKLQYFLNKYESAGLSVTGDFDDATEAAVKAFQTKYAASILSPWGVSEATGIVYITTSAQINRIFCNDNPNYRNGDITDYTPSETIYEPVDNSDDFTGVIGSATTTATSTGNLAAVFEAFKNVPWYSLLILLLILLGSWIIGQEIFKKDMKSPESIDRAMNGVYILSAAIVLNVLNTVSFMINPLWFESRLNMGLAWIIILDALNLVAVLTLVIAHFILNKESRTK